MLSLSKFGMQLCCVCGSILSLDDAECNRCKDPLQNQIVKPKLNTKPQTIADQEHLLLVSELINLKYKK